LFPRPKLQVLAQILTLGGSSRWQYLGWTKLLRKWQQPSGNSRGHSLVLIPGRWHSWTAIQMVIFGTKTSISCRVNDLNLFSLAHVSHFNIFPVRCLKLTLHITLIPVEGISQSRQYVDPLDTKHWSSKTWNWTIAHPFLWLFMATYGYFEGRKTQLYWSKLGPNLQSCDSTRWFHENQLDIDHN
jgi:hypothetical protein